MRRKEVRARKEKANERYLRRVKRRSGYLLVEKALLRRPIAVEVDRPKAPRPKIIGFWMDRRYYAVQKVVEIRREHGESFFRVITEGGAFDLRRGWQMDRWTLRITPRWEAYAALEAIHIRRLPPRL